MTIVNPMLQDRHPFPDRSQTTFCHPLELDPLRMGFQESAETVVVTDIKRRPRPLPGP